MKMYLQGNKKRRFIVTLSLVVSLISGCGNNMEDQDIIIPEKEFDVIDSKAISIDDVQKTSVLSMNQMGLEIFREMAEEDTNQLFSPTSLAFALAMLQNGGEGETKEGILKVLGQEERDLNKEYNVLMNYLASLDSDDEKGLKLKVGNSLWIKDELKAKQNFIDTLNEYYHGQVFQKDFGDRDTIKQMNLWVEEQTNGLLKDTVTELDPLTVSLLMNTIYFKGTWINEFSEGSTRKNAFYSSDTKSSFIDMMHTTTSLSYFEDKLCQMTSLPYFGGSSMVIILPKENINDCLDHMDSETLEEINDYMSDFKARLELSVPKLDLEVKNDLNDVLIKLGMETAFSPLDANFKSMIEVENENVFIDKIYQNTRIILDEKGTEAAAVTVVETECTSAMKPEEPIIFNCNKPFIYLIKDDKSGAILFIGIVRDL